jgi:HK97 family phage prohead protease
MLIRAHSLLEIKEFDDAKRTFSGIATSVTPDRMGDVVEPGGAVFKLPLPFLYQHDSTQPIGNITEAVVKKDRIEVKGYVENVAEPASLKERLDVAWAEMKAKLVRGLSIGFNPLETARIKDTYSYHYLSWEWLELSAVTIPAQADATIITVKQYDTQTRAALGLTRKGVALLGQSPGASGTIAAVNRGAVKLIPR